MPDDTAYRRWLLYGCAYNFQEIRGSTRATILEDANYQPTCLPGQAIQICLSICGDRRINGRIMTVNNVTMPVSFIEVGGVSFPQQGHFILAMEWDHGIHSCMNKHSVRVDMKERQVCYPIKVRLRNLAQGRSISSGDAVG